jgi:hypothetical protein
MNNYKDNSPLFNKSNINIPKLINEDLFIDTLNNHYNKFSNTEKIKFCNSILKDELRLDSLNKYNDSICKKNK